MKKSKDLPSTYVKTRMNKLRVEAYEDIEKEYGLKKSEAQEILQSEPEWAAFLKEKERQYKLGLLRLSDKFTRKAEDKMKAGSMEQAKSAVVALSIIRDNVFGDRKQVTGNTNVQINLPGWKFKPYRKG